MGGVNVLLYLLLICPNTKTRIINICSGDIVIVGLKENI